MIKVAKWFKNILFQISSINKVNKKTQLTFTCSKLTIQTLKKDMKYVQN